MDFYDYSAVVACYEEATGNRRVLGNGFFISETGTLATCAHVIRKVPEGNRLYVVKLKSGEKGSTFIDVDVVVHPRMDFALIETKAESQFLPLLESPIYMGDMVAVLGTLADPGDSSGVIPSMFSGNVVRCWDQPVIPGSASTMELSFPIISGLSGSMLVATARSSKRVCGMAYGNKESAITTHKVVQIEEDGNTHTEKIDRVIELGCGHTATDIRGFLTELGY